MFLICCRDFAMAVSRLYFNNRERLYRSDTGEKLLRALPLNIVSPPIEMLLIKV